MKFSLMLRTIGLTLMLSIAATTSARVPDDLEQIQRETRIVQEVLQSALRQELRGELRVTRVEAEYLAQQGVFIEVTLNTPWLKIDDRGEPTFQFHGDISIPEIPAMVTNILQDLQINVAPYEPEALEELRELRDEQRELRMEGREHRAELRAKRRELVREQDEDDRQELQQEITQIEKQLELIDQQYDALTLEIEQHYAQLRAKPVPPPAPQVATAATPPDVDTVLSQAVCDYGSTLKALHSEDYITLAVRKGRNSRYLAYRMDHIKECSRGNIKAERLLQLAYQYEG